MKILQNINKWILVGLIMLSTYAGNAQSWKPYGFVRFSAGNVGGTDIATESVFPI